MYPATWTQLVTDISDEVVARLAAAGYPPLTPEIDGTTGAIQIGPQFVAEQGAPPRVLFVPRGFDFSNERSVVSRGPLTGNDYRPELAQRAIARQWKRFEVQCWGCHFTTQTTPAPDPALDYDAAQALSEIVWQACQSICAGVWRTTSGEIDPSAPTLARTGRVFVFDLALDTPILDTTLAFAPHTVAQGSGLVDVTVTGTTVQAYP